MARKTEAERRYAAKVAVLASINEEALTFDGYEDALIGYVQIFNRVLACYDREKCIEILMRRDGMSFEEADEFFEFNTQGAYVGENTPAVLTRFAES